MEHYLEWLEDMEYSDTEENYDNWFENHCQFCGACTDYGSCGCDHNIRY